jgi:hypothetical protein
MSTRSLRPSARRYFAFVPVVLPLGLALQAGCSDTLNTYNYYYQVGAAGEPSESGGAPSADNGAGGDAGQTSGEGGNAGEGLGAAPAQGGEGGEGPDAAHRAYPDAPHANTSVAEQSVDVFGVIGNRYWFAVSEKQLLSFNENGGNVGGPNGDLYSPTGQNANYVDHLWVTTAGEDPQIADYGKVQVKIAGQSTWRPWTERSLPSLNLDSNEFVDKQRIGGFEHLRFNNAQIGGIFREYLAIELYRELGYPSPLTNFGWVSSNVWGGDVQVPYVLVERYKRSFCARGDAFGGKCENMWEFQGDFGWGEDPNQNPGPFPPRGGGASVFDDPNNCQFSKCTSTHVKELEQLLRETPDGDGFKAATEELIDWPAFHRFQCLSWTLATGDDALHNQNNVVLAERADGKFQFLPYSVDFSLGNWWSPVPLAGMNRIALGCQADKQCWDDTIATCEDVLADFENAKPAEMLDDLYDLLHEEGMLRPGDEGRYAVMREWLDGRLEVLTKELEENRAGPNLCSDGFVFCNGFCNRPEDCFGQCKPPVGKVAMVADGAAGAPGTDVPPPNECPVVNLYPM